MQPAPAARQPGHYTVFPDGAKEEFSASGFETKNIQALPQLGRKHGKPIQLFVVGCVDYRYSSSSKNHQTGFVYEGSGSKDQQGIQVGMTIPVNLLTFEPYAFGGEYAY